MQLPRKMSAHNVMASITRTLRTKNDAKWAASNAVRLAGEESKEKLYEPKHKQKLVRVLTVVAYVISVSLAAIILSLYYMFLWDPKDKHYSMRKSNATGLKVECLSVKIVPAPPIEAPSVFRPELKTDGNTKGNRDHSDMLPKSLLFLSVFNSDDDRELRDHRDVNAPDVKTRG